jgi:Flp pilus assembly secretin CpaC
VSAGTKLQVKPRIIPAAKPETPDRVWLSMELQDGGFVAITVDAMPMTRTSSLETQAEVTEGNSIMLAGYLRDIKESGGWGIPYLRDIPWIGWLFGGASYRDETVQRMFILTPYVIDVTSAGDDLVTVQAERQRDIENERILEEAFDKDGIERKELEAQVDFRSEARRERAEERHERNEAVRDFERDKRHDAMEVDHEQWETEFEGEKARYEAEKAAAAEAAAKAAAKAEAEAAAAAADAGTPEEEKAEDVNVD